MNELHQRELAPLGWRDAGGMVLYTSALGEDVQLTLEVSVRFSDRLLDACQSQCTRSGIAVLPVIQGWADMSGWWDANGAVPLSREESQALAELLAELRPTDFDDVGPSADSLMRCAQAISHFLRKHLDATEPIRIECV